MGLCTNKRLQVRIDESSLIMKIRKTNIYYTIPFCLLLFQQAIIRNDTNGLFGFVSYLDELYVSILLFICVVKKKFFVNNNEKKLLICYGLFLGIGLISSLVFHYQNIIISALDAFICSKFLIVFFCTKSLLTKDKVEATLLSIYRVSKHSITMIGLLTITNIFVPIFPRGEYRYFMNSTQLFFGHPTFYAVACMTCVIAIVAKNGICFEKKDELLIYVGLICTCLSLRTKAIAGAVVMLAIYIYYIKFRRKNIKFAIAMGSILALYLGYDQIAFYYGGHSAVDENFVRERLLFDSIRIANTSFPLGSGFGTFASDIAKQFFSPLYSLYGYSVNTPFLSDTFWPIVIAQSGYIGFGFFTLSIIFFVKDFFTVCKNNKYYLFSLLSIFIYLFVCSLGESAFFHPYSIPLFMIAGIVFKSSINLQKHSH